MPDVIDIGGLALNGALLTALISAFAGYAALWLWTARARGSRSGPWGDMTVGATAIAVVIWKFGVLIREPSLLWEQPQLLLVIVGSGVEAAAGLAAAAIFWIWLARRNGIGLLLSLDALAVSAAGGLLAWNLLSAIEYRWGYTVVCAVLLVLLIGRRAGEADRAEAAEETVGASEHASERTVPAHAVTDHTDTAHTATDDTATTHNAAAHAATAHTAATHTAATHTAGSAAVLAGYVLGAGCLVVSLFATTPPWVKHSMLAGLTDTQLLFIGAGLAAAALDAYRGRAG